MTKTERNTEICQRYVAGETLQQVADRFQLSRERVRQLLRKAKVFKHHRFVAPNSHDNFLGVNVEASTKIGVKEEAERLGVSVSRYVSDTLDEKLGER